MPGRRSCLRVNALSSWRRQGCASVTCRGVGCCLGNAGARFLNRGLAGTREGAAGGRHAAVRPQTVRPGSRSGSAGTYGPRRPARRRSLPGSQHQLVPGGRRLQCQAPGSPVGSAGRAPGERATGLGSVGFASCRDKCALGLLSRWLLTPSALPLLKVAFLLLLTLEFTLVFGFVTTLFH